MLDNDKNIFYFFKMDFPALGHGEGWKIQFFVFKHGIIGNQRIIICADFRFWDAGSFWDAEAFDVMIIQRTEV